MRDKYAKEPLWPKDWDAKKPIGQALADSLNAQHKEKQSSKQIPIVLLKLLGLGLGIVFVIALTWPF